MKHKDHVKTAKSQTRFWPGLVTSLPENKSTENGRLDAIFQEPDRKEMRIFSSVPKIDGDIHIWREEFALSHRKYLCS